MKLIVQCGVAVFLVAMCFAARLRRDDDDDLEDVAKSLGLTDLLEELEQEELDDVLEGEGTLTVFAPTNAAFDNVPAYVKQALVMDTVLSAVLEYHVVPGLYMSADLSNDLLLDTALEGKQLRINTYTVDGQSVVTAQCAPVDLAQVDNSGSNGVIHVLNSVMIPPMGDIAHSVGQAKFLTTLASAVQAAGLGDVLSGDGPFTIFAPSDTAFSELEDGLLDSLLANTGALAEVLKYHVVPGAICSAGLSNGSLTTVQGQEVTVSLSDDGIQVNDANVLIADGSATNGVIYIIDNVLVPEGLQL